MAAGEGAARGLRRGASAHGVADAVERRGCHVTPRCRRRHRCLWTREEDLLLAREWQELSTREMRARLGRTATAIIRRAKELGLPPPSSGRSSPEAVGARLGVAGWTVMRFAESCGIRLDRRAAVSVREERRAPRYGVEAEQIETLFRVRMTRVVSGRQWERSRDRRGRETAIPLSPVSPTRASGPPAGGSFFLCILRVGV